MSKRCSKHNTELTYYEGFDCKPGLGEWFCETCDRDKSNGVPDKELQDQDTIPITWPSEWDISAVGTDAILAYISARREPGAKYAVIYKKIGDRLDVHETRIGSRPESILTFS